MSKFKRRDFLKTTMAGIAAGAILKGSANAEDNLMPKTGSLAQKVNLPDIPTCDSMRSIVMTHKFGDLYSLPGLTNQWGCASPAMDAVAVRSIAFPPYAQGEMNVAPLGAGGELLTGVLYIDEEYFAASKTPVDFVWRPDRVERKAIYKGLEITSTMIIPFQTMSVAVKFTVKNITKQRRKTEVKLAINGGATKSVKPWNAAYSPGEYDNERTVAQKRNGVLYKSKHTSAYTFQGASPRANNLLPSWIIYNFDLAPNESKSFTFVNSLGETKEKVEKEYDTIVNNFDAVAQATNDEWNAQLKAAFTPNNPYFSGYVPTLVTSDDSVKRIYHNAVTHALYFRRTTPHSVYGTTYVTLMPRYWETTTFLWDISLSAMLLSMLDPEILKRMMEPG